MDLLRCERGMCDSILHHPFSMRVKDFVVHDELKEIMIQGDFHGDERS